MSTSTETRPVPKKIEDLRESAGTLPSEAPKKSTNFINVDDSIEISLIDYNRNPYKTMFATSTATWGDNEYKDKWSNTSAEGKLDVIKAVLTNNTLPQAREMVNFVFRVKGTPRWLFDLHTQTPFTSFMSIGCRDNNKLDADMIINDSTTKEQEVLKECKDLYEAVIEEGAGSWQSARTFLPQCYQHSYHFGQNLLSIASMKIKNDYIKMLYDEIITEISVKFPLIACHAILPILEFDSQKIMLDGISKVKFNDLDAIDQALLGRNS